MVGALALSACGGSDNEGGEQGGGEAASAEGSFAVYDWEPNVVAAPGVSDPTETAVSKEVAERVAAHNKGTIVLREPAPLDIPQTKIDESKDVTRNYYVLRDRPALEQSDVESATVQVDPTIGQPSIIVNLTPEGQRKLGDLTFREARRGSSPPTGPLGGPSIGPRRAIVVGDEILLIQSLGPGRYTREPVPAITVVSGFDEQRARELADSIDPG
jgi:hypothetical protein